MLQKLFEGLLELIYPSNIYCISCGNIIDDTRPYSLCDSCVRTLHWNNQRSCSKCGKILREDYQPSLCTDCLILKHSFEKGFACIEYGNAERDLIHNFKYKDKAYLGRKLSEMMYDRIDVEDLELDLLIPVPMHKKKQNKRGYNQSEILAKGLSKAMKIPCHNNLLIREQNTEPMSSLDAEARRENVKNAFTVPARWVTMVQGKNILLVDDIFTTGSTADACSGVLLKNGANKVYIFCLAAGANMTFG